MYPRAGTSKEDVQSRETSLLFDDSSFFANISEAQTALARPGDRSDTSALNVSALCCDEEVSGFDKLTGRTWIYPTNYPVRDYQFNIIKAALFKNTLVSLPTGLGKTFIAAVVMYNMYRWYPLGKVVFAAPTRPLVAQQMDACYEVAAIPRADTIEMTGHMPASTRKQHWRDKRVFFATPQVIYNDLKSGICPAERVRCLVLDEAHRARGNYAYVQIVSTLTELGHRTYRVLALSATPGSKVEHVVSVVRSLLIAHLELRTEGCIDVAPYSHTKQISTVVVPLGTELTRLRHQYVEIVDSYARRLKQLNIVGGNIGNLSKGRIIMLYKEFQAKERSARHPQHNNIMKDFTLLISLYHGLELLARHGARVFLNFFDGHAEKAWVQADDRLTALLERLRDDLGADPLALDRSSRPDGTVADMPANINFGHPKFDHLREIVTEHFGRAEREGRVTKAIVFCEYRESVNLVHCLLLQCRPIIKPMMFVGQGASGKDGKAAVSQKAQLRVMRAFREGACNALAATCVAEEGLDVGSVDLIVCFDVSTRSPVRLVQRCGRTGRERAGRVHILVTEGREHQTLQECMRQRDNLNRRVLNSPDVQRALYALNPRMLPRDLTPACCKMHITAAPKPSAAAADGKVQKNAGQRDLRSMLVERARPAVDGEGALVTRTEYEETFPTGLPSACYLEGASELWARSAEELKSDINQHRKAKLKLSEWLEWQRTLQNTVRIGHSSDTETLTQILQYADEKRFQLPPSTQNPIINTQMMSTQDLRMPPPESKKKSAPLKKKTKPNETPRHGGDIRALFSTTKKSTKEYTKLVNELGMESVGNLPTSLIDLMVDLCVQDDTMDSKCLACEHIFDCGLLQTLQSANSKKIEPPLSILKDLKLPNINLLDNIDVKSIVNAGPKSPQLNETRKSSEDLFLDYCDDNTDHLLMKNDDGTNEPDQNSSNVNATSNFDLEFDFDFDGSDVEESKSDNVSKTNFDIGKIEDIFVDSSSSSHNELCDNEKIKNSKEDKKETLEFFGLDSIDDIFADSNDDDVQVVENSPVECNFVKSQKEENSKTGKNIVSAMNSPPSKFKFNRPPSPSLLAGTCKVNDTIVCSPILCSQKNRLSLNKTYLAKCSTPLDSEESRKSLSMKPKSLFGQSVSTHAGFIHLDEDTMDWSNIGETSPRNAAGDKTHKSDMATGSKSLLTITQIIDMVNKPMNESDVNLSKCKVHKDIPAHTIMPQNKSINLDIGMLDNYNRSSSPILFTQADVQTGVGSSRYIKTKNHDATVDSVITRSPSPILLTQRERGITSKLKIPHHKAEESLIVLNSDSDDTEAYNSSSERLNVATNSDIEGNKKITSSNKRKHNCSIEDPILHSSYFNKRAKLDNCTNKPLSLKDKLKLIFKTNSKDMNSDDESAKRLNNTQLGFVMTSPHRACQKENKVPDKVVSNTSGSKSKKHLSFSSDEDIYLLDDWFTPKAVPTSPVLSQRLAKHKLQIFRRDNKSRKENYVNGTSECSALQPSGQPDDAQTSDSDDDFVIKTNYKKAQHNRKNHSTKESPVINYKVRKKKKRKLACSLVDLEAEVSGESADSGDEASDGSSAASLADFICDELPAHLDHDASLDMHAHYLRSVKSPVNGMFKIPLLPQQFSNVLSQPDHGGDDYYEMDSFCVDANVGLTQAQDISELELAERRYRRRKRAERRGRAQTCAGSGRREASADSPVARPSKIVKRKISSSESE